TCTTLLSQAPSVPGFGNSSSTFPVKSPCQQPLSPTDQLHHCQFVNFIQLSITHSNIKK
ncbi:hypothetical protein S245_011556, partial [Arachis hypogaea]